MENKDVKRLSRLTAILTQLQTKRLTTATSLAKKHGVSVRTIYRDIKALEGAGIPIFTEEGKGYSLMEGYRLPPVMFTESEANALITAEQLVLKNKDLSLISQYAEAIQKIKAVLKFTTRKKTNFLSERILVRPQLNHTSTSNNLTKIQHALTEFQLLEITYKSVSDNVITKRKIEPFAFYNNSEEYWNLIAYCRLRKDFRQFRLDRILQIDFLPSHFKPHPITLKEYVEIQRKKYVKAMT
jgi:predicted DNA-binding transcriptional regulator YafY